MNHERRRQAERIFQESLDRASDDRAAFLEERCDGDPEARVEVQRLLDLYDDGDGDLTRSVGDDDEAGEQVGDRIGRYELVERLGAGGMGVVWRAVQHEPVQREVAVKLVKVGMDTREVIRRFRAERQLLASLEHPNIARIVDAGATAAGRPYLVMEIVRGAPITVYCDELRLTIEDRVRLFIDVCRAIHHAHQRGVIHRDLKPTNLLVTEIDGDAVPRVIDFGVAKVIGGGPIASLVTRHGQVIGTPAYMSPEQADPARDVDVRGDVYALGVVLYELLTGTLPHDTDQLGHIDGSELARWLQETRPRRPSARIRSAPRDRSTVRRARARRIRPRGLWRRLAGDLDWIVLKAIDPDPARRYASASEFAADLEAFLDHRPVTARPPSLPYIARRCARRYRVLAVAIGIVAIALAAATAVSVTTAREARRSGREAEQRRIDAELASVEANLAAAEAAIRDRRSAAALRRLEAVSPEHRGWEWHHLRERVTPRGNVIRRAETKPLHVEYAPGGGRLVATWESGTVDLIDPADGAILASVEGDARTHAMGFDATGRLLAVGWRSGRLALFDAKTLAPRWSVRPHARGVASLAFADGGERLMTASGDGTVRVIDTANGSTLHVLRHHGAGVTTIVAHDGARRFATSSVDRTARLWNLDTLQPLATLDASRHEPPSSQPAPWGRTNVTRLHFTADGTRLVSGTRDGTVRVFDARDGRLEATLAGLDDIVRCLDISHDDRWVAVGTNAGSLFVWDLDDLTLAAQVEMGSAYVYALRFHPSKPLLAAASWDNHAAVFDVEHRLLLTRLLGHRAGLVACAFADTGQQLATASADRTVRLWPMDRIERSVLRGPGGGYGAAFDGSGRRLAVAWWVGRGDARRSEAPEMASIFDAETGRQLQTLTGHTGGVIDVAWSPADSLVATASRDTTARIFDAATGECLQVLRGHEQMLHSVAFSRGGRRVLTCSADDTVRLWDVDTGALLRTFDGFDSVPMGLADRPRGDVVLAVTRRGTIVAVPTAPEGSITVLRRLGVSAEYIAHARDGRLVAVAGSGGAVHVVDVGDPQSTPMILRGHTKAARSVAFSPDGRRLASGANDHAVCLWDVAGGRLVATFENHVGNVHDVEFALDGLTLVSSSDDGTVRLLQTRPTPPMEKTADSR